MKIQKILDYEWLKSVVKRSLACTVNTGGFRPLGDVRWQPPINAIILCTMHIDGIKEVGIDDKGRLYVAPKNATFPMIYRDRS